MRETGIVSAFACLARPMNDPLHRPQGRRPRQETLRSVARALLPAMTLCSLAGGALRAEAETITIAAAADLKYALTEIADTFRASHPGDKVEAVFGSSGKLHTQIQNGAPYDFFFSADIAYPRELHDKGLTTSPPRLYAIGRIVLWSIRPELASLPLKSLPGSQTLRKFAIANPEHAPYGRRAREALRHEGVWEAIRPKLVMGENVAHAAQYVDSGAAEAGIVALSLVKSPALAGKGAWMPIPAEWHAPLEQAYVITVRARNNPLAAAFATYLETPGARAAMQRHGFVLPGE